MKKKNMMLSLCLAGVLLLSTSAFAASRTADDTWEIAQETSSFQHGDVPALTSVAQSMTPPINAMVLYMVERHVTEYNAQDPEFFWGSLYYMLSLCGEMDSRAVLTDETLILPSETVADYAAALFTDYQGLLPLPDDLSSSITYDAAQDSYLLARGDVGLTETVLDDIRPQEGGVLLVSGRLTALEDGSTLKSFQVTLTPNQGMFGYAISQMVLF